MLKYSLVWTLSILLAFVSSLNVNLYWNEYGSSNRTIWGDVEGLSDPQDYTIAIAIQTNQWWGPKTSKKLSSDGSFVGSIGSATNDIYAVRLCVWLGTNISSSTSILGLARVNISTVPNAIYFQMYNRKVIDFNGYAFVARDSDNERGGPNDNYFSNNSDYVYLNNETNQMHLNIWHDEDENKTYCSEIYGLDPLDYGSYVFVVQSRIDMLDKDVVLGLFTYDSTAADPYYNEIDIEIAKWTSDTDITNSQYVIQPYYETGRLLRFQIPNFDNYTQYNNFISLGFYYQPDYIIWTTMLGNYNDYIYNHNYDSLLLLNQWNYTNDTGYIFPPGNTLPIINYWLANNTRKINTEVIINNFIFCPDNWADNAQQCLYYSDSNGNHSHTTDSPSRASNLNQFIISIIIVTIFIAII